LIYDDDDDDAEMILILHFKSLRCSQSLKL
jgi:hypothetical protein